jgi:hypothetical protein
VPCLLLTVLLMADVERPRFGAPLDGWCEADEAKAYGGFFSAVALFPCLWFRLESNLFG